MGCKCFRLLVRLTSRFKSKQIGDVDNDHETDTNGGQRDNHPRRTYAAELGLFLKILAKAQYHQPNAKCERDKANQQIV